MDEEDTRIIYEEALHKVVEPIFLEMLQASEDRINDTNLMVTKLSEAAASLSTLCDTQLNAMTRSRDTALANNTFLIQANIELTKAIDKLRDNYSSIIFSLREELNSAKHLHQSDAQQNKELQKKCDRLQEKLDRSREEYYSLVDKYDRIVEKSVNTGISSTNVKVNV